MHKVCMFNVYFGNLPHWLDFFVQSANYNQEYDFYIFNDKIENEYNTGNVYFKKMTIEKISQIISDKFNRTYKLNNIRKLCDWKTVYGRIFSEISQDYDFWGHCDLDMIWGNMSNFITNDDYQKYDIISGDQNRLCGPFNLFKTSNLIDVYKYNSSWQNILFNLPHVAYDEIGLDIAIKAKYDKEKILYGMGSNKIPMQNYGSPSEQPPLRIPARWKEGDLRILEDERETMFIHMGFKKSMKPIKFEQKKEFFIHKQGIKI